MRDTITFGYDEVGNLASKNRSGTAADMTYTYDLLHGWVKQISSSGGFKQILYREDNTGNKLYNGSISAMTWKIPAESYIRRYDYTYDGMNRLTEGTYSQKLVIVPPIINSTGNDPLALGGSDGEAMPLDLIPATGGIGGGLAGPGGFKATDRYTERIWYDKNSNIEGLKRYGMNNQRQYGLIDSLFITRNGNQLKTIEDYAEKHLTYTGASDFYDGMTSNNEYSYNANGALVQDLNRKIGYIGYDNLGNIRNISFHTANANSIEYIYAADGTKLRTIHRPASSSALTDSIDYIGNLILKNGQPSMYIFDGGYASFGTNGAVNGWHYYIQDYMGNNRMVVNSDGTIEQVTHYYPYGGVIGDISTNENVQKYKFEGKELDRTFGLDNYDIHARQYFAMMPSWDRIDPLAEYYYGISPYSYCGGDPVNRMDLYGDSIQLFGNIFDIVIAIYNAIPNDEKFVLTFTHDAVIDPNSIPDSSDPFLQDLKYVAGHEKMVEMRFSDSYEYMDSYGKQPGRYSENPYDYYDSPEEVQCLQRMGLPSGKSMTGDTGISLFPFGASVSGKVSTNSNIQVYVNTAGSINHRSIGIAHELVHVERHLKGLPHDHTTPGFNQYLYDSRLYPLFQRLGYDYVSY